MKQCVRVCVCVVNTEAVRCGKRQRRTETGSEADRQTDRRADDADQHANVVSVEARRERRRR